MDKVIDAVPNISIISQLELLCRKTDETTTLNVKDFIDDSVVLDIIPAVVMHCVKLRKIKKVKTPDAIIAATALAYSYTIITNNGKDFDNVSGL